jgi:hypothetical protein
MTKWLAAPTGRGVIHFSPRCSAPPPLPPQHPAMLLSALVLSAAAPAVPHTAAQNKSVEIAPCV